MLGGLLKPQTSPHRLDLDPEGVVFDTPEIPMDMNSEIFIPTPLQ